MRGACDIAARKRTRSFKSAPLDDRWLAKRGHRDVSGGPSRSITRGRRGELTYPVLVPDERSSRVPPAQGLNERDCAARTGVPMRDHAHRSCGRPFPTALTGYAIEARGMM